MKTKLILRFILGVATMLTLTGCVTLDEGEYYPGSHIDCYGGHGGEHGGYDGGHGGHGGYEGDPDGDDDYHGYPPPHGGYNGRYPSY